MIISNGKVVSGDIVTRVTSKVYNVTRSVVGGVERFTLQSVGRGFAINELTQIGILLPVGVTNTTATPVLYWNYTDPDTAQTFTGSLPIKRNNGDNLSPGDLQGNVLYQLYRPNDTSVRLTMNITSYDLLQNKPRINGIEVQGSQNAAYYNLPNIEIGEVNKLKVTDVELARFNLNNMTFGNLSYKFNLFSNSRPGMNIAGQLKEMVYLDEYITKTDSLQNQINNFSLPDYYKGQVNTLDEIDITGARPSDFWYVLDLGEVYENVPGNATWNGTSLDIAPDFVFHPDGVTIGLNAAGRIEVIKVKNKLTFNNGEDLLEFDGSEQLNLTAETMKLVKDDEDYQQLLDDVANKINKFTIAENTILISDGEGQIKDSGKLLDDIIFELTVNNIEPVDNNITIKANNILLSDEETNLETRLLNSLDLTKVTSQEIAGPINYLIKPQVLGSNVALFSDIPTDIVKTSLQTLSAPQKEQSRENIGAGTSNFSGSYTDLEDKPQINGNTIDGNMIVNEATGEDLISYYVGEVVIKYRPVDVSVTHKRGLNTLTISDLNVLLGSSTFDEDDILLYENYVGARFDAKDGNYNKISTFTLLEAVWYNDVPAVSYFGYALIDTFSLITTSGGKSSTICSKFQSGIAEGQYSDSRFSQLASLVDKSTILSKSQPTIYKLDNPTINQSGSGYLVNDNITVGSFSWIVAGVNETGGITAISGIDFDAEFITDVAQIGVDIVGGSGSGAAVTINTYYKIGGTTERGTLQFVPTVDPLVQKSYVDLMTSGGIPEAPIDGKAYGRQDGEWTNINALIDNAIQQAIEDVLLGEV